MIPAPTAPTAERRFADELRKWWSFDNGQQHTHTWHSREDFIEKALPKLLSDALAAAQQQVAGLREAFRYVVNRIDHELTKQSADGRLVHLRDSCLRCIAKAALAASEPPQGTPAPAEVERAP